MFISYRRDDSQYQADKLHAALHPYVADPSADLFIDVDSIPFGEDFAQHIESKVLQCDVLLAVIGKGWLGATDPVTGARRLDSPDDFVRLEIGAAMRRGIPVVPILLDGVQVPSPDELPQDLKPLARRNGIAVQRLSFEADIARLMKGLGYDGAATPDHSSAPNPERQHGGRILMGLMAVMVVAAAATFVWIADPLGWRAESGSISSNTSREQAVSAEKPDALTRLQSASVFIICSLPNDEIQQASGVVISPSGHVLTAGNVGLGDGRCVAATDGDVPSSARPLSRLKRSRAYDAQVFRFADPEHSVTTYLDPDLTLKPAIGDRIAASGYPTQIGLELTTVFGRLITDSPNSRGVIATEAVFANGTYGGPVILEETGQLIGIIAGRQQDPETGTVLQSHILSIEALSRDLLADLD